MAISLLSASLALKAQPPTFTRRACLLGAPLAFAPLLARADSSNGILRLPAPERLVAVGDLHGDCTAFERVLSLAGLYEPSRGWTGGSAILVQIGDILDRGDEELRLFELLRTLKTEAAAAGGRVISLLGNHEVLNAVGISVEASPKSAAAFDDRSSAFRVGSEFAAELAAWPVACVVGDTAFVHAGLTLSHVSGLGAASAAAAEWLRGGRAVPPDLLWPSSRLSQRSPLWMRDLSDPPGTEPPPAACADLQQALQALGAKRLVVGHTVQPCINAACGGGIVRIDVGLSAAMRNAPPQALEVLRDGRVRVLTERGVLAV